MHRGCMWGGETNALHQEDNLNETYRRKRTRRSKRGEGGGGTYTRSVVEDKVLVVPILKHLMKTMLLQQGKKWLAL